MGTVGTPAPLQVKKIKEKRTAEFNGAVDCKFNNRILDMMMQS